MADSSLTAREGMAQNRALKEDSVQDALAQQLGNIKDLADIVVVLKDRLSPVLGDENPTQQAESSGVERPTPQRIITNIRDNSRGIRSISSELHDIVSRLQI